MRKLAIFRGVCRVVPTIIFSALLLFNWAQAAVLQDFRLGVSEKRTRLVYQFDQSALYTVERDSSSVRINFTDLLIPDRVKAKLKQASGGMLAAVFYDTTAGQIQFTISSEGPFLLRYFDLIQPQRLVIDLYPKSPPPAATVQKTPEPEPQPVAEEAPVEEPEEIALQKSYQTAAADTGLTQSQVSGDTITPTEEPPEISQAEEPKVTPVQPEKSPLNWLYFALPVLIVLLIVIGFITLRRAARREISVADKPLPEEEDVSLQDSFDRLFEADEQKKEQSPGEELVQDSEDALLEGIIEETEKDEVEEILPERDHLDLEGMPPAPEPEEKPVAAEEKPDESVENIEAPPREAGLPEEESEPTEPSRTVEEAAPAAEDTQAMEEPTPEEEKPVTPAPAEEIEEPEKGESLSYEPILESAYAGEAREGDVTRRLMHKRLVDSHAQLNFEEGRLIWSVHLLDGERAGRVMVVDDEEEIVATLREFLLREKYEVIGITDSLVAVEEYKNWHPDLLIVDVVMPGLSGVELVQRLRDEDQPLGKIIFLSGRTERDTVAKSFSAELDDGRFEFFRKPLSLVQIGGRIRDYFTEAQEVLHLNLLDAKSFQESIQHLTPYQLVELQRFLWDRIFEISANFMGRRIESYYITDRMEPPANYMRRVGCQEREDYCIANECFSSNPMCAAEKIRGELEVMRQIIAEFREEYVERVVRNIGGDAAPIRRRPRRRAPQPTVEAHGKKEKEGPPPRKTLRRLVSIRKR